MQIAESKGQTSHVLCVLSDETQNTFSLWTIGQELLNALRDLGLRVLDVDVHALDPMEHVRARQININNKNAAYDDVNDDTKRNAGRTNERRGRRRWQ